MRPLIFFLFQRGDGGKGFRVSCRLKNLFKVEGVQVADERVQIRWALAEPEYK